MASHRLVLPVRWQVFVAGAFFLLFLLFSIAGAYKIHFPGPLADMWGGYLEFYLDVMDGDVSAWWRQHNEHRILLAKLLFWLDLRFFAGTTWFLIGVNFLLALASGGFFWRLANNRARLAGNTVVGELVGFACLIMSVAWMQRENLTGAFQSQFFLAQQLPLAAFFCLSASVTPEKVDDRWFVLACLFGTLSIGSMANGILALPLLIVQAILLRVGLARSFLLAVLTAVCLGVFFSGYQQIGEHGSLAEELRKEPFEVVRYVLNYLGGPVFHVFKSPLLAEFAGMVLIGSGMYWGCLVLSNPRSRALEAGLLMFVVYVAGTALGTAGGRLSMGGAEQAFQSRYQTPALMAWCCWLVLLVPAIVGRFNRHPAGTGWLLLAIPLCLLPGQWKALRAMQDKVFEQRVAALALTLGVRDEVQVRTINADVDGAEVLARRAGERGVSIFGQSPYREAAHLLGSQVTDVGAAQCHGVVDTVEFLPEESRYVRKSGWIDDTKLTAAPKAVLFVASNRQVIGYAVTSVVRDPITGFRFKGYALANREVAGVLPAGGNCVLRLQH